MEIIVSSSFGYMLFKVALFIAVQALVYVILSKSSNVFSKMPRSYSFRTARSVSIRRMAAALADIPSAGELSPPPKDPVVLSREKSTSKEHSS
ncbi:hypothetical protein Leryth_017948 [Lithospermum erythrorhizon]|nr:hypothetical protein Leryth_017948 [Lithospermum erythrorhizon]